MVSIRLYAGYIFCLFFMKLNGIPPVPAEYASMLFEMSMVALCLMWVSPLLPLVALPVIGMYVGQADFPTFATCLTAGAIVALPGMILATIFGVVFAGRTAQKLQTSFDPWFWRAVAFPLTTLLEGVKRSYAVNS